MYLVILAAPIRKAIDEHFKDTQIEAINTIQLALVEYLKRYIIRDFGEATYKQLKKRYSVTIQQVTAKKYAQYGVTPNQQPTPSQQPSQQPTPSQPKKQEEQVSEAEKYGKMAEEKIKYLKEREEQEKQEQKQKEEQEEEEQENILFKIPETPQEEKQKQEALKQFIQEPQLATVISRLQKYVDKRVVEITRKNDHIAEIRPKRYLGAMEYEEISKIVKELGGKYISAGKESRWEIPLKKA